MSGDRSFRTGEPTVSYDVAVERVKAQAGASRLLANSVAGLIWPKHRMKAQGAAFAAGPFIRRMLRDGVLSHDVEGYRVHARTGPKAKADPHANGCPDSPGICECFSRDGRTAHTGSLA